MSTSGRRAVALLLIVGMLSSAVVAGGAAFFASSSPDGLESVAESEGFAETAEDSANADSPLADYGFAGVEDEQAGFGISAAIGLFVTLGIGLGLFMLLTSRRKVTESGSGSGVNPSSDGSPTVDPEDRRRRGSDSHYPGDAAPDWPTSG